MHAVQIQTDNTVSLPPTHPVRPHLALPELWSHTSPLSLSPAPQTHKVSCAEKNARGPKVKSLFSNVMPKGAPGRGKAIAEAKERGDNPPLPLYTTQLDPDGMPAIGTIVGQGDPICCSVVRVCRPDLLSDVCVCRRVSRVGCR